MKEKKKEDIYIYIYICTMNIIMERRWAYSFMVEAMGCVGGLVAGVGDGEEEEERELGMGEREEIEELKERHS